MKKKYLLISIPIVLIIIVLITILILTNKTSKYVDDSIDQIRSGLNFLKQHKYQTNGRLKVTASYKGAHGEHYPRGFDYFFNTTLTDDLLVVTIGNNEEYVTKEYRSELYEIMDSLKNADTTKLDYLKLTEDNKLDVDIINDVFKTDYKVCTIDVTTKGLLKKYESSTIKCDEILTIKLEENKATINYGKNIIKIDINEAGFSLSINDKLKMNSFYEDNKNRYNIVIDDSVYYLETMDGKIYLKANTQAAIYNAMEVEVTYDDVVVNKIIPLEEIEIPIYRYFNEIKFDYWRDTNE